MTYIEQYENLIQSRIQNPLDASTQSDLHHIKPKSIYPQFKDDSNNLIRLTIQEHIEAHYLLFMHYEYELKNSIWANKMKGALQLMVGKHKLDMQQESLDNIISMYMKVRRVAPKGYLTVDTNGIYEANWKYNKVLHRKKTKTNDIIKAYRIMMRWIDQTINGQLLSRAYKDLKPCKQHGHLMRKGSKNEWFARWMVNGKTYYRNTKTIDKTEAQKMLDKWIINTIAQKYIHNRKRNYTGTLTKRIRKDGTFRWYARWMVNGKLHYRTTRTDNYDEAQRLLNKWISETVAIEFPDEPMMNQ